MHIGEQKANLATANHAVHPTFTLKVTKARSMRRRSKDMGKKLGRPRKTQGVITYQEFARAGIVMSSYDEARENGQKHSVAVAESVEFVRQRFPRMRISETAVRRILAGWRPRESQTILRFECSTLTEDELVKFRWIQQQLGALRQESGLPAPSDFSAPKSVMTFKIRFGERPNYPRHNRKTQKE
jgi:hypothetical protein